MVPNVLLWVSKAGEQLRSGLHLIIEIDAVEQTNVCSHEQMMIISRDK